MNLIEINGLRKRYKDVEALRGFDLKVPEGTVCGFLGRNGAGKTTTLKILLGLVRPNGGSAQIFGLDCTDPAQSVLIRQRIGFVTENKDLYPYMTVGQTLRFTAGFFPKWRHDLAARYLKLFALPEDRKVTKLSKGNLSKLMLLLSMARGAELLILDEPTDGLDPAVTEEMLAALVDLAAQEGVAIFFSSHQLQEVEQIADRVCIIHEGRAVLQEELDELRSSYRLIQMVVEQGIEDSALAFTGVEKINREGRVISVLVSQNAEQVIETARARQATSIDVRPVGLKEIFLTAVRTQA